METLVIRYELSDKALGAALGAGQRRARWQTIAVPATATTLRGATFADDGRASRGLEGVRFNAVQTVESMTAFLDECAAREDAETAAREDAEARKAAEREARIAREDAEHEARRAAREAAEADRLAAFVLALEAAERDAACQIPGTVDNMTGSQHARRDELIKARDEAARMARVTEIATWAEAHGSETLRLACEAGLAIESLGTYRNERLAHEFGPGWEWDRDAVWKDAGTVTNPTLPQLRDLLAARAKWPAAGAELVRRRRSDDPASKGPAAVRLDPGPWAKWHAFRFTPPS